MAFERSLSIHVIMIWMPFTATEAHFSMQYFCFIQWKLRGGVKVFKNQESKRTEQSNKCTVGKLSSLKLKEATLITNQMLVTVAWTVMSVSQSEVLWSVVTEIFVNYPSSLSQRWHGLVSFLLLEKKSMMGEQAE